MCTAEGDAINLCYLSVDILSSVGMFICTLSHIFLRKVFLVRKVFSMGALATGSLFIWPIPTNSLLPTLFWLVTLFWLATLLSGLVNILYWALDMLFYSIYFYVPSLS